MARLAFHIYIFIKYAYIFLLASFRAQTIPETTVTSPIPVVALLCWTIAEPFGRSWSGFFLQHTHSSQHHDKDDDQHLGLGRNLGAACTELGG